MTEEEYIIEVQKAIDAIDAATEPMDKFKARQAAAEMWSLGGRLYNFRSREFCDLWKRIKAGPGAGEA